MSKKLITKPNPAVPATPSREELMERRKKHEAMLKRGMKGYKK